MFSRVQSRVLALVFAGVAGVVQIGSAQNRRIAVLTFDQSQVAGGFQETFGRADVNVGRSLANFVARRLRAAGGWEIVEVPSSVPFSMDPAAAAAAGRSVGAEAVVAGSILAYGSSSSTAGVRGPGIGRVRLGVGRRTSVAGVSLEARLVDVASGTMVTMVPAQATANRSGLALFAEVPDLIDADGIIDMSREEFSNSLLGEATNSAVGDLVRGVTEARGRIGQMAAAPAAAPTGPAVTTGAVPSGGAWTGGAFAWTPYRFRGTEHFRYDVTRTEGGSTTRGYYQLDLAPAGSDQVRMQVQGQVGDDAFNSTTTVPLAQDGQPGMNMGLAQLMTIGPVGMLLFNPSAWIFLYGRQLNVGDGWSQSNGGETFSVRVDQTCAYAGQNGYLVVMRENDQVRMRNCLSPNVALPLLAMLVSDDDTTEMTLTEYRP